MKTIALMVFAAALSSVAAEKIEGAFGKKLGDAFDPAEAIGQSKLTDGTPMYQFSPTNAFRSFSKYYVLVTPTSHRIFCIWASGSVESTEIAKKEQAVIMELLQTKYGGKEKEGVFENLSDVKRIDQGKRDITSKISGFTDITIDLRYYDRTLEKVAERERIAEEAKKVDKSGL